MRYIEDTLMRIAGLHGFGEIRTPTFEHTELFVRSVGDTTDVVQKEMYTFEDKKGRSITLKPEGTAGAVRAALERGLLAEALPLKLSYITPCFRYEKAQAGRYREFHAVRRGAAGRPGARLPMRKSSAWYRQAPGHPGSGADPSVQSTPSAVPTAVPSSSRH